MAPSSSSTNSGIPSERSETRSIRAPSGRSPRMAAICVATSDADSRSSSSRSTVRCCSQRAEMRRKGCVRCSSSERTVKTSIRRRAVGPGDEECDQVKGGRVGPLDVLEGEHQRAGCRQPPDDAEQQLQDPRWVPVGAPGRLPPVVELRHQAPDLRPGRSEQRLEVVVVELRGQHAEHVDDRCVGNPASAELDAAADERAGFGRSRPGDKFTDQPRLADPRLPADQHGHRVALQNAGQRGVQRRRLRLPTDEDRAHKTRRHRTAS